MNNRLFSRKKPKTVYRPLTATEELAVDIGRQHAEMRRRQAAEAEIGLSTWQRLKQGLKKYDLR